MRLHPQRVGPDQVQAVVTRAGYRAQPLSRRRAEPQTPFWRRDARSVSTVASVVLLAVAVARPHPLPNSRAKQEVGS